MPAALVNGAAMHVLDYEPMWLPATHALSPALAAALALGETLGSSGAKILTAMVLGIEIQGRLRQAAGALESHELHFHPPGFVGPIGAAVAAGHLLDFDADQFANAIGIAGSRCGGLFVNLGTMTKATHCAYAAALGLEAALLTRRGFTGCRTLFDPAPQSYAEAFFPRGFAGEALLDFGAPFRIVDPGYAIKIFPAKFSTHYAITAALSARPQLPSPDAIRVVRITAADVPSSDRPQPRSGLDGKFSLQYTTAAALLDGQVGLASFTDERLHRDDMQALLGKIEVRLSRDIPEHLHGRPLPRPRGDAWRRQDHPHALRAAARIVGRAADHRRGASRESARLPRDASCPGRRRDMRHRMLRDRQPRRAGRRARCCISPAAERARCCLSITRSSRQC